jgi:hypothetical protein
MGLRAIVCLLIAAAPVAAQAQYRCVGKDGKTYYGQTIPPECIGKAVTVVKPPPKVERRRAEEARDAAERDADMLRRQREERTETTPGGGVLTIGNPASPTGYSPPSRDEDAPSTMERDGPDRFRGQRPHSPER